MVCVPHKLLGADTTLTLPSYTARGCDSVFLPFSHHKAFSLCIVRLWKTQSNDNDLSS